MFINSKISKYFGEYSLDQQLKKKELLLNITNMNFLKRHNQE